MINDQLFESTFKYTVLKINWLQLLKYGKSPQALGKLDRIVSLFFSDQANNNQLFGQIKRQRNI